MLSLQRTVTAQRCVQRRLLAATSRRASFRQLTRSRVGPISLTSSNNPRLHERSFMLGASLYRRTFDAQSVIPVSTWSFSTRATASKTASARDQGVEHTIIHDGPSTSQHATHAESGPARGLRVTVSVDATSNSENSVPVQDNPVHGGNGATAAPNAQAGHTRPVKKASVQLDSEERPVDAASATVAVAKPTLVADLKSLVSNAQSANILEHTA